MRLMAGRRLAFRTNSALFKDTSVRSWNISELTNATGQQRKENGQLRVTLILFEKKIRQTSPSFEQIFLQKTRT